MYNTFKLRMLTAAVVMGLFCPAAQAVSAGIGYKEIGDAYISSFGIIEQPIQKDANAVTQKKEIDFSSPVLSEHEKRKIVFELQARQEKADLLDMNPAIAQALAVTLEDIDAYYGSGADTKQTLMKALDNTTTIFGKVELAHALAHPISVEEVQNRQEFIKLLIADEALFNEISALLKEVKKAESGMLSYWQENDPVTKQVFEDLYFKKWGLESLNANSTALEAYIRLGNLNTAFKSTLDLWVSAISRYCMHRFQVGDLQPEPFYKSVKESGKILFTQTLNPKFYWDTYKSLDSAEFQEKLQLMYPAANPEELQSFTKGAKHGLLAIDAVTFAYIAYRAHIIKGELSKAKQTKDAINYLQAKLIDVATFVESCKQLDTFASRYQMMGNGLMKGNAFSRAFNAAVKTPFTHLVSLLQANTFKGSASFFSRSGNVLAANKLMTDNKDEFASLFAAFGEVDACVSMAKLYKAMHGKRVQYCFVNFVQAEQPYLKLDNFWNPFVAATTVVPNSLEMGAGTDTAKIILTGSNTGGKSTILKGTVISLLLAKSFGIVPADAATMTPFDFVGSYLRVNDDTAAGDSKFKAEVLRAKMLVDTLSQLPETKFGFVVIDELFTGTGSENASKAAYKVAQKLSELPNSLYILATHFPLLTTLADTASNVKNYKVDVFKDDKGNLIRPFKIEPGISSSNIANDILNEEITSLDFGF